MDKAPQVMRAMLDTKAKFRQLTAAFDPIFRPQQSSGSGSFYVAETHADFRAQLTAQLELSDNAKLLVAGQPGCGKSTLLLNMADEQRRAGRPVAFVDVEALVSVEDLDLTEVYVAAIALLLEEAERVGAVFKHDTLVAAGEWVVSFASQATDTTPSATGLAAILRTQLGAARSSHSLRATLRIHLARGGPNDPLQHLRAVLSDLAERRPLLILDGLDKVPPEAASRTFLTEDQKPLVEVPGSAILTIPLSLAYEAEFNVLGERYNNAENAVLPAVRLWNIDPQTRVRSRSPHGQRILRLIVERRVAPIDPLVVEPDAVDRAIEGSGGNIRQLARLMQSAVVKAHVRQGDRVEIQDIEGAIADQRESYRRAYDPQFLEPLRQVHDACKLDASGDVVKRLLYGLWITEYRNGEIWYCLPEPVAQLLRQLERKR